LGYRKRYGRMQKNGKRKAESIPKWMVDKGMGGVDKTAPPFLTFFLHLKKSI
jgi:ATP-dependent protease HslVU (ClpYQ) ATPase subunit